MKTHEFTIVATGLDPEAEGYEDAFFDAGCDDALLAFRNGRILVHFMREATGFGVALESALDAVRSTGARVLRVEPDPLVSLANIAERAGLTRAAVTLYRQGKRGSGFPAPVARVTTPTPLWDWAEVAAWLCEHKKLPKAKAEQAQAIARANAECGSGAFDPTVENVFETTDRPARTRQKAPEFEDA